MTSAEQKFLNPKGYTDRVLAVVIGEIMQCLTIAHVFLDGEQTAVTRVSGLVPPRNRYGELLSGQRFVHTPWAAWTRQSDKNYAWLHDHLMELIAESERRSGKLAPLRAAALATLPLNIPIRELTMRPYISGRIYGDDHV